MPDDGSTRSRIWREIQQRHRTEREQIGAWVATDVIAQIPDEEWTAMHTGTCTCGTTGARLYPCGWRCTEHAPGATHA
jgi:hypothetical protein